MRTFWIIWVICGIVTILVTGCASTGKHVKDTVDNVHEYALFGDEYSRW
ncbi:MAG: hypothetical protein N2595_04825 [bacterium]|nr:hypothetical protein [bacterium]